MEMRLHSESEVNRAGKERTIRNGKEVESPNDITLEKERSSLPTKGN